MLKEQHIISYEAFRRLTPFSVIWGQTRTEKDPAKIENMLYLIGDLALDGVHPRDSIFLQSNQEVVPYLNSMTHGRGSLNKM